MITYLKVFKRYYKILTVSKTKGFQITYTFIRRTNCRINVTQHIIKLSLSYYIIISYQITVSVSLLS